MTSDRLIVLLFLVCSHSKIRRRSQLEAKVADLLRIVLSTEFGREVHVSGIELEWITVRGIMHWLEIATVILVSTSITALRLAMTIVIVIAVERGRYYEKIERLQVPSTNLENSRPGVTTVFFYFALKNSLFVNPSQARRG